MIMMFARLSIEKKYEVKTDSLFFDHELRLKIFR